jgi:hypothetical protein
MPSSRTSTETERDCTLKVRGELIRFPGNSGCFVRCLMNAREDGRPGADWKEIATAVWGAPKGSDKPSVARSFKEINQQTPGLITYNTTEELYSLTNRFPVEKTRAKAPAPLKGHPRLIVSQLLRNNKPHNLNETETRLIELMLKDRAAYRTVQEIGLAIGTASESSVRNTVYAIKQMNPNMFEGGGWGRGWRLLLRDRAYRPVRHTLNYVLTPEERAKWLAAPGRRR